VSEPAGDPPRDVLRRDVPHRQEGEAALAELLPPGAATAVVLGDGALVDVVLAACPELTAAVVVDAVPGRVEPLAARHAGDGRVRVVALVSGSPLAGLGRFDVVIAAGLLGPVAEHRRRPLLAELAGLVAPGGMLALADVVRSATPARHAEFVAAGGAVDDDVAPPELGAVVDGLREAGLGDVDCLWRWRACVLVSGRNPLPAVPPPAPVPDAAGAPALPSALPSALPTAPSPTAPAGGGRYLADALGGIAMPCGLAPLTHGVPAPAGAFDHLTLATDVDATTVVAALVDELTHLGYAVTWDGPLAVRGRRGDILVRAAALGTAPAAGEPKRLSRKELRRAVNTPQPFGTAPPGATVVQLWV
jgi:hypothetical protein